MPAHVKPSICFVEKNCLQKGFCSSFQTLSVLDFDKVKETYYHGVKSLTPASVDAVSAGQKGTAFCFVELKGWQNYIDHQKQQRKTIEETVCGYNLAGKLFDSQALCIDLAKDPDLFAQMPVLFILVTDINPAISGIDYIHSMLTALGETTTEIYSHCVSETKKVLDSEIHIDKVYMQCREFDKFLQTV